MNIRLTRPEVFQAAQAGLMRRMNGMFNANIHEKDGPIRDSRLKWGDDIEAAGAEMAVAKAFGLYWRFQEKKFWELPGDVGNLEVKHTIYPNGKLILQRNTKPDRLYLLVRGQMPQFTLVGFIAGQDGMKPEYLQSMKEGRKPVYVVPCEVLRPISELDKINQPA